MTVKMDARSVAKIQPQAQRMEYFDADCPGLALRVTPSGVKSWVCFYRIGKRLRRWTIGTYKTIGLADARTKARNALRKVPDGIDPALTKQERREAGSFGELADLYVTEYAKPRKRTWRDDRRLLNNEVLPSWRHRPARDITRADVREIIEAVAARPAPILANRLRALIHRLFEWAIEQEHVDGNPVAHVRRPGVEQQRDRVLTEDEIRTLWKALDGLEPHMAAAFKLRLITAQRGGEVADMRWSDVDLEGGWWTIPGERAKNGLPHRVPLAPMAVGIIAALKPITGLQQTPVKRRKKPGANADPVSEPKKAPVYVLAGARGKRQRSEAAAAFGIPDFIGHDLRRTAATFMGANGVSRFVIGKVLNHAEKGVTSIYDRASYDAEKQAVAAWWDAKLTAILEKKSSKVLAFARGA